MIYRREVYIDDNMSTSFDNVNYDGEPDVLDIHIHLDERHLPDPVGPSDWVVLGIACFVMGSMLVGNIILMSIKNRSMAAKSKNIPIVLAMSMASIIHSTSVLLNEIFFLPMRVVTDEYILNQTARSVEGPPPPSSSMAESYPSHSGPGGILEKDWTCVWMYFWLEYFFGLSFFLSLLALRLIILLNAASKNMRIAVIHLRKKFAIRTLYILMFCISYRSIYRRLN